MRDTNGAYADRHQEVTVGESQDRLTYILSENNALQTKHNYHSLHKMKRPELQYE